MSSINEGNNRLSQRIFEIIRENSIFLGHCVYESFLDDCERFTTGGELNDPVDLRYKSSGILPPAPMRDENLSCVRRCS